MGAYKIKDIENLTGIKAHTIRIWEKRYGILKPQRTDTLIRMYDDEELKLLLNISLLNKNGFKISRIADMSNDDIIRNVKVKSKSIENCFHENLLVALIDLNEDLFNKTLQELIDEVSLEHTFINHIIPFLEKIGVMWVLGTINPAQEHFISNLIRQKLISEIDKMVIPDAKLSALLYLPEHENHEISLLFYAYILRKNNIRTVYLGQLLPFESLLKSIEIVKPNFIVSSWVAAVEEDFLNNYFQSLINTIDSSIQLFSGGNQLVKMNKELTKKVNLINSIDDLKKIYTNS